MNKRNITLVLIALWLGGLLAYVYVNDDMETFVTTCIAFVIWGILVVVQVRRGKWFPIRSKEDES